MRSGVHFGSVGVKRAGSSPAAAKSGALIHLEKRFGDIGRSPVRQASVAEALAMLRELAEAD